MSVWTELRSAVSTRFFNRSTMPASLGEQGERQAERFLKKRKYRIVARGYRNHIGEIDLIAVDQKSDPRTVVFVEVKTRRSDNKGLPVEAVDERKQRQISETAMVYLKQHQLLECRFRFDIIGIIHSDENQRPLITHYVDAFDSVGQGQLYS